MSKSTHGGRRKGAGRKPSPEPLERHTVTILQSHAAYLRRLAPSLSEAIRKQTQQEIEMKTYKWNETAKIEKAIATRLPAHANISVHNDAEGVPETVSLDTTFDGSHKIESAFRALAGRVDRDGRHLVALASDFMDFDNVNGTVALH